VVQKNTGSAPLWAWLLGLLPWVWIIPFNQYFWDDWYNSSVSGLSGQIDRWAGTAKHWLNPFIYFVLQSLGPWAFHVVIVTASLVGAYAITKILTWVVFIPVELARWSGPIFLALPVFHARFSAATLEYSLGLATLLLAWSLLLESRRMLSEGTAVLLLIFAIGVPSLAILFPLIWIHLVTRRISSRSVRDLMRLGLRYSYVLVIPLLFSLVFSKILNSANKYKVFSDGWIDWRNDFIRLLTVSVVIVGVAYWKDRSQLGRWVFAVAAGHLVYVSLFPYFQVGYKPLNDYLPWRMRYEIRESLPLRLLLPISMLAVLVIVVVLVANKGTLREYRLRSTPALVFAVVFGAAAISLGPLDWESRHWLIAWPCLVVFLLALGAIGTESHFRLTAIGIFSVCLAASLYISSEYLVDSLKQKAILRATRLELVDLVAPVNDAENGVAVVVQLDRDSERLNARLRKYRPYEWWGLIASGLNIEPTQLKILEQSDYQLQAESTCAVPLRATSIYPKVLSSRWDALTSLRVDIRFDAREVRMCSISVIEGWPRDGQ